MRIVYQQTVLVKYYALFVIFEKAAKFEIIICCKFEVVICCKLLVALHGLVQTPNIFSENRTLFERRQDLQYPIPDENTEHSTKL